MDNVSRCGLVSIIGRPNVGKSTLMNHLIGQKIAITSERPQTTRNRIRTVYTDERGQIVFLDTPGVILKKANKLGEYMEKASLGVLKDSDAVMWIVEPSAYAGEADAAIANTLSKLNVPVIAVISKIDLVPLNTVQNLITQWKKYPFLKEVVPVSGLKGKGLDVLLDTLFDVLPVGPMLFDEETVTDIPMRDIAGEIIREQALRILQAEIPHGIAVMITSYKEREDGVSEIEADVICEKESHKPIIIGKGGQMLKRIGTSSRIQIEKLTGGKVFLKLFVKVRKDWRDDQSMLRQFGYDRGDL